MNMVTTTVTHDMPDTFWYRVFFGGMNPTFVRFLRYQSVAFSSFLIDLAVLSLLLFVFNANYLIATAIGFMASVGYAFFINRLWSFKKWVHTGRIMVSLGVGLGTLFIVLFVTYVGVETIKLPYFEARIGAALIAAVVSYIGDSIFTFEMKPFE
ncbi:MAG TPA: GtrA family protein [Candidatus Paceibacterota bacterium]|jgi:putative flippase GtrA|nr:GtrA family protein [Candidatus Paceibacterota bacterium]